MEKETKANTLNVEYQYPHEAPVYEGKIEVSYEGEEPGWRDIQKLVAEELRKQKEGTDDVTHRGIKIRGIDEWTTECPECGNDVLWSNNPSKGGDHEYDCEYLFKSGYQLRSLKES